MPFDRDAEFFSTGNWGETVAGETFDSQTRAYTLATHTARPSQKTGAGGVSKAANGYQLEQRRGCRGVGGATVLFQDGFGEVLAHAGWFLVVVHQQGQ